MHTFCVKTIISNCAIYRTYTLLYSISWLYLIYYLTLIDNIFILYANKRLTYFYNDYLRQDDIDKHHFKFSKKFWCYHYTMYLCILHRFKIVFENKILKLILSKNNKAKISNCSDKEAGFWQAVLVMVAWVYGSLIYVQRVKPSLASAYRLTSNFSIFYKS